MFLSKLLGFAAQDDLQKIENQFQSENFFSAMPKEIVVNIASFLELRELFNFSVSNQFFFKLFFNHNKSSVNEVSKLRKQAKSFTKYIDIITEEKNFKWYKAVEETDDFQHVQQIIWRGLVVFYFPKFEKSLKIKNWMHVLRRRIAHLMIHGRHLLPLHTNYSTEQFEIIQDPTIDQIPLIDKCEWIYKCPLSFNSLLGPNDSEKYCVECKKTVYLVEDETSFKSHVSQGHCVAIGKVHQMMMMGEFAITMD